MNNTFEERFNRLSDNDLIEVLRHRNDYQDAAVQAAIRIAIERQIIHSEIDLISAEYQSSKTGKSIFFPVITNQTYRNKIIASVFRMLYFLTAIPLVYGVIHFTDKIPYQPFGSILLAVVWFLLCFKLSKRWDSRIHLGLTLLLIIVIGTIAISLAGKTPVSISDIFITMVGSVLSIYLLLLLKHLHKFD